MSKTIFLIITLWLKLTGIYGTDTTNYWWKDVVLYQIYPRSFKDTDGNGIGDLRGIESKAKHFTDMGIGAVWLSPVYKSPMADFGYDISDFKDIDPLFGDLDDFKSMLKTLKSEGIRVLMDYVPNHTSDEHEWFEKSKLNIKPYSDYYIWADPKGWVNITTPVPPNNWVSVFEGSAWEYVPERKQYYLHQFAIKQPDLNYRNPKLVEEMKKVLRFWLDLGVDGIRLDAANHLVEDKELRDEPKTCNYFSAADYLSYYCLDHIYTKDLPETYEVIQGLRAVLDEYAKKDGISRLFLTEVYASLNATMTFYGTDENPGAHMPFNFYLLYLNWRSNAEDYKNAIHTFIDNVPEGKPVNWVIGNHDNPRPTARCSPELIDALHMLVMLLPGTAISYNGDELGMTDTRIRWDQTVDINGLNLGMNAYESVSRDPERTPYQWDSSRNAGFSETHNKTWLPVNPNAYYLNLAIQKNTVRSHYNVYKALVQLRSEDVFRKGKLKTYVLSEWVFAFTRTLAESEIYVVVVNLGSEYETVKLTNIHDLEEELYVRISSVNSEHNEGDFVSTLSTGFSMNPKSSLVLSSTSTTETETTTKSQTETTSSSQTDTTTSSQTETTTSSQTETTTSSQTETTNSSQIDTTTIMDTTNATSTTATRTTVEIPTEPQSFMPTDNQDHDIIPSDDNDDSAAISSCKILPMWIISFTIILIQIRLLLY